MRKISPQQLLKENHILEKLEISNTISTSFCLDDYLQEEVHKAIQKLNELYPCYQFEHKEVFSGYGHDLVVTNKERKQTYDQLPTPHTYGELFEQLEQEHGFVTSAKFHHSPSERLTEEEYQETLDFYKKVSTRFFDELTGELDE